MVKRLHLNIASIATLPDLFTTDSIEMMNVIPRCEDGVKKKSRPSPPTEPLEICVYYEIDMEISVTVSKPSLHPSDILLGRGYQVAIICQSHQHTASDIRTE
jgi:hypothetical protein